jgi:acyl transferase domain-containing protein
VAQVSALSPDGRCKAFGADADGYGRGEGIASIVMRPLEDAEPGVDDRPLALLTGSAVNQDGRSSSLTVSSVQLARRYRTSRANSSQDAVQ